MILHNGTQNLAKGHSKIVRGILDAVCKSSGTVLRLQHCPRRDIHVQALSSLSSSQRLVPTNLNGDSFKRSGAVGGRLEPSNTPHTETNGIRVLRRSAHSESATQDALISDLRNLMRALPHSVVVITTSVSTAPRTTSSTAESNPQPHSRPQCQYKGMTLSSFTTLTLTPSPLVTFNIRDPSQTLSALAASKSFLIHVLRADQAGARVADAFTRGNAVNPFEGFKINEISSTEYLKEEGGMVTQAITLPKIEEDGVLRVIKCRLLEDDEGANSGLFKIGDHVVVFGKVDALLPGFDGAEAVGNQGLLYINGAYHTGGEAIEPLKRS